MVDDEEALYGWAVSVERALTYAQIQDALGRVMQAHKEQQKARYEDLARRFFQRVGPRQDVEQLVDLLFEQRCATWSECERQVPEQLEAAYARVDALVQLLTQRDRKIGILRDEIITLRRYWKADSDRKTMLINRQRALVQKLIKGQKSAFERLGSLVSPEGEERYDLSVVQDALNQAKQQVPEATCGIYERLAQDAERQLLTVAQQTLRLVSAVRWTLAAWKALDTVGRVPADHLEEMNGVAGQEVA